MALKDERPYEPQPRVTPSFNAADLVEAVKGWRAWRVPVELPAFGVAPKLYSATFGDYFWKPRTAMEAECDRRHPCSGPDGLGVPGENCSCVPLDTEILTQRGWLRYDEVVVGDQTLGVNPVTRMTEWTTIRRVVINESQEVLRVGNDYWSARATADHMWPVWAAGHQHYLSTVDLPSEKRILGDRPEVVTKAPYVGGHDPLTPTEAAIIAWLHTDGAVSQQRIIQSKPAGVMALRSLLADVPHTVGLNPCGGLTGGDMYAFRLRSEYFRDLWHRAMEGRTLSQLVLSLSRSALEAFMEAAFIAEGSWHGTDRTCRTLTQNVGPVFDALNLGVYLLGYRPRVHAHDSASSLSPQRGVCRRINYAESKVRGATLSLETLGSEPTWCVTTDLGTWTMRQDEHIMPTKNCGFYSAKTLDRLLTMGYHQYDGESYFTVVGVLACWGKVIECQTGWRAQYAYPRLLYVPFEAAHLAKPLKKGYGVPVRLQNILKDAAAWQDKTTTRQKGR